MTIYTEKFTNETTLGQGTLQVIKEKSRFVVVAYVGCEYPEVLVSGTLDDCRRGWNKARAWVRKQMGI